MTGPQDGLNSPMRMQSSSNAGQKRPPNGKGSPGVYTSGRLGVASLAPPQAWYSRKRPDQAASTQRRIGARDSDELL